MVSGRTRLSRDRQQGSEAIEGEGLARYRPPMRPPLRQSREGPQKALTGGTTNNQAPFPAKPLREPLQARYGHPGHGKAEPARINLQGPFRVPMPSP